MSTASSDSSIPPHSSRSEEYDEPEGQTFYDYERFLSAKLSTIPNWKKPFVQFRNDCERALERYYEEKYNLPPRYLRGMLYHKPRGLSISRAAKRGAKYYERQELLSNIQEMIASESKTYTQITNQCTSYLDDQIHDIKYSLHAIITSEKWINEALANSNFLSEVKQTARVMDLMYKDLNYKLRLISEVVLG